MQLQRKPDNLQPNSFEIIEPAVLRGYPPAYPAAATEVSPMLVYWNIIRKRRWVVLATATVVFAMSVIATLRMTKLYEASARIAIFPENLNALGLKDSATNISGDDDPDMALETQ